jgi:hypothetical protein
LFSTRANSVANVFVILATNASMSAIVTARSGSSKSVPGALFPSLPAVILCSITFKWAESLLKKLIKTAS